MADLTRELMYDIVPNYPTVEVNRPIKDNVIAYQGLWMTADASGNIGPATAGEKLVGLCKQTVDNTGTSHAAARKGFDVLLIKGGIIRWYISGTTRSDIDKAVYISDNATLTTTATNKWYVGRIIDNNGAGLCTIWLSAANIGNSNFDGDYPMSGYVSFNKLLAATTTAKATQYDMSAGNGTLANLVQPDHPRNVVVTVTDANASVSAFTITVTGTDCDGAALTEVFVFGGGLVQTGVKAFLTITSIILTASVGHGAGDTIDIGHGVKYGIGINGGSSFLVRKIAVDGVNDTIAAQSATYMTFTPTTAANGTKIVEAWYTYERTLVP
jgi:hypothetical protein